MTTQRTVKTALLALMFTYALCGGAAQATARDKGDKAAGPRPTIVLVHGAFADGSSWQKVIPLLEREGYPVTAVQTTLTGLADDVASTKRVIDAAAEKGPVVVVGHSYGGAVITGAATNPAVKALVYVNAFAPDAGEVIGALAHHFGPGPLDTALVPDKAGFLTVDRTKFRDLFCADVDPVVAQVAAAVQKPTAAAVFGQSVPVAAWKTTPSWYLVGKEDRAISPELERFMAQRMGAHTTEIHSSHVPFFSHPDVVARLIIEAARSTRPISSR
jgi:pimeloyl-ACP methyl ester carboxylesterase